MPKTASTPARRPGLIAIAILLGAATLLPSLGDPAMAAPVHEETRSIAIHANAHPENDAEARALFRKIGDAAEKACAGPDGGLPFHRIAIRRSTCFQQAVARTVERLNSPILARVYNASKTEHEA